MKSIQVNQIKSEPCRHSVTLGDGTIHTFKSLKKAKKFQCTTNKFLTQLIQDLNLIYSDTHSLYRSTWNYFYHTKITHKSQNRFNECKLIEHLSSTSELLNTATTNFTRQHSFYRIYRDIQFISDYLKSSLFIISNTTKNKSIILISTKINHLLKQINSITDQLKNYSSINTNHIITYDKLAQSILTSIEYSQSA